MLGKGEVCQYKQIPAGWSDEATTHAQSYGQLGMPRVGIGPYSEDPEAIEQ